MTRPASPRSTGARSTGRRTSRPAGPTVRGTATSTASGATTPAEREAPAQRRPVEVEDAPTGPVPVVRAPVADAPREVQVQGAPEPGTRRTSGPARLLASARAVPHMGTWIGVGLCTLGVLLLVYGWGKVAGLTSVALQLPYLASAGFGGVGLVATGLTVLNVAAKQADAAERTRQLGELRALLRELRRTVEED